MIEYCKRFTDGTFKNPQARVWCRLPKSIRFSTLDFNKFGFRVNGKEYKYKSKEFAEEFEKARIWEML